MTWDRIKDRLWLRTTIDPELESKTMPCGHGCSSDSSLCAIRALVFSPPIIGGHEYADKEYIHCTDMLFEHPDTLIGNWGFVLVFLLVSVLTMSEEIVFRGILLPKMRGVFGRADWIANGVLFALYHLDRPWLWPGFVLYDTLTLALPARLFQSTWFSIIVHFSQTFYFLFLILSLVLGLA
jgi:hypothetical protein